MSAQQDFALFVAQHDAAFSAFFAAPHPPQPAKAGTANIPEIITKTANFFIFFFLKCCCSENVSDAGETKTPNGPYTLFSKIPPGRAKGLLSFKVLEAELFVFRASGAQDTPLHPRMFGSRNPGTRFFEGEILFLNDHPHI